MPPRDDRPTIYTIGHSTRTLDELVAMLKAHGVQSLADVRHIPRSRHVPQFNADALTRDLPAWGLRYVSMKSLGGRRRPLKDSINTGWHHESFRGYADFMQTPEFAEALDQLIESATRMPTATMCAEAVPWRCHRSLISDALLIRGWRVLDIISAKAAKDHKLTSFAKVDGLRITYPAEQQELFHSPGM